MLKISVTVFLALASVILFAQDATDQNDPCDGSGNQMQLNDCAAENAESADQKMQTMYMALIKKERNDQGFVRKLEIAQKAWLAYRDAEIAAEFSCSDDDKRSCWGSRYPMLMSNTRAWITENRIAELKEMLSNGHGN